MTTIRILHVDDEPDIREVVEVSLGLDQVFAIRGCGSGVEALTVAADWRPDIILLDVTMPEMDGAATLVKLRESPMTAGRKAAIRHQLNEDRSRRRPESLVIMPTGLPSPSFGRTGERSGRSSVEAGRSWRNIDRVAGGNCR